MAGAFTSPSQQPVSAEQPALLKAIEASVRNLMQRTEFEIFSPFADRGGVWELRLASKQLPSLGFISVACDDMRSESRFRCEVSAGAASNEIVERRMIGRFSLAALTPGKQKVLADLMTQAIQTAEDLSQRGSNMFPLQRQANQSDIAAL